MPDYDSASQVRAADELASLPADAELRRYMLDYVNMRDQSRACRGPG